MDNLDIFVIFDRIADRLLQLLVALSWLLLASFFVVALGAARAHADDLGCGGDDIIAAMAKSEPAKLETLQKQAAATENGTGLLWKIEKPGIRPSYLFGTMHLTDPRVLKLSDATQAAYQGADTVVIETDEVLDPKAQFKVLTETPELMMFTDATTLDKLIPKDKVDAVKAALQQRGLTLAAVNRMQPWMLTSMLAMPACELARTKDGTAFLDIKLARDAQAAGKKVAGLETIKDQLGAMASLPMQFHIDGLMETLALGPRLNDIFETMTVLYTKGEIGMIFPLMRSVSPDGIESGSSYAAFEETMVNARNRVMADRASSIIDQGSAFIAVGALHLPGKDGLVSLLRNKGYKVSAE
ncbi:TraB/GumN family protein [Phyllobacterium sp. BT25]|uniref:TraB/GumN family protein n=1 Tax=Phyllobacterium pellucidum TaxID=2740464 RepID=A0A849VSN9_9HYPH|nr:TraB/GumN family protein [Phyllobacterium pellucidum]NTS32646.1 TraB/GumN family protein [Phyllobacterium pellucidum]